MSKSSKRRLARAAILNAIASSSSSPSALSTQHSALPSPAKSLLQAAAQTAASPFTLPRATGTPAGVPSPFTISLCDSATSSLSHSVTASLPSAPSAPLPLDPSAPSSSELSNLKSSDSVPAPSLNAQLSTLNSSSPAQVPSAQGLVPTASLNSQLSTPNSPSSPAPSPPQRGTGTLAGVHLPSCSPEISNLKSPCDSDSAPSTASLCHSATVPLSPTPSAPLPLDPSSFSSSELSNLKSSDSPSPSALSTQHSALLPALAAARASLLQSTAPDPILDAITPDQIFIDLPPLPPTPPSPFTGSTAPRGIHNSALPLSTPALDELSNYQEKLRTAMREWCPADPRIKTMLENYATLMQTVTLERLSSTLTTLSEDAWVKTNAQITRLHAIMERTSSRHAREQREIAAQARRELREKQRKDRQTQKEQEALARTQRNKEREENRRQREKEKSDRAEQNFQLAMRKLDLKERTLEARTQAAKEKLEHRNAKLAESAAKPQIPMRPHSEWTCG